MTIEEAIKHCIEVAEKAEVDANYINLFGETPDELGRTLASCIKCAEEHRQLAEWLNELKRARVLLKATYELLMKQNDSGYVLNLLSETIFYDEAECDGCCLMEDIENLLEYHV